MRLKAYLKRNYELYLMLIPTLVFVFIFNIVPKYGLLLAFKDYDMFVAENPMLSVFESAWNGLKTFKSVFTGADFPRVLRNTLIISTTKIVFGFPIPIIFAILLNELQSVKFQKVLQTAVYLPHFLSWVVVAGIFVSLLSSNGIVNKALEYMGFKKVPFLMSNDTFRGVLVVSATWKEFGWSSIIYFAAIAGLDQDCFEAALIDGANRFQKIRYITLPGLLPTIVLMLVLRVGGIMNAGFAQVFAMYNSLVYETGDIIDTYIYRLGLGKMEFSTSTVIGLFDSAVGMILVLSTNRIAKKLSGKSIW